MNKNIIKLKKYQKYLPEPCNDFLRSISTTTSELTRIAYAIDYKVFFEFAIKELPKFSEKNILEFNDNDISMFNAKDFDIYIDYLKNYSNNSTLNDYSEKNFSNSDNGIMRKLSSLRSLFGYLFRMERIPANTAELVPLPKIPLKPILFMEDDEVSEMIDIILNGKYLSNKQQKFNEITRKRDYAIIMLFLGTGMRISELIGIDINDIDLKSNAVLVTRKGGNSEILYFPDIVKDALDAYLLERNNIITINDNEEAFFLSLQRKRITARAIQNLVKKYATLASPLKKRLSPHKLRSTYATNLYNNTGDIYLVADALGHADVNTTRKHYASISDKHRREAANNVIININKKDI